MRGRTFVVVLVALLSLLTATAVAGGHRVVMGTKSGDELTTGSAGDRVFARGGDDTVDGGGGNDRLRGGQGEDHLDGGDGNDYLNGRGDGGDPDEMVCGAGRDTVMLGRNDVIVVDASSAVDEATDEPAGDEVGDEGCETVKGPGAPRTCASHRDGCETARPCIASTRECGEDDNMPCASNNEGCDEPVEEPCVATLNSACDDPVAGEPEADPAARAPKPREPGA